MRSEKFELVKYRDAGMNSYTYFWKDASNHTISPFFDSESQAQDWMDLENYKRQAKGLWSDSCTTQREDKLGSLEEAEEFAKKRNYRYNND